MNILFSTEAYIGLIVLVVFFVLNEIEKVPMVPSRFMPLIAVAAAVVVFLFYRDII